jgi:hypothetical protein
MPFESTEGAAYSLAFMFGLTFSYLYSGLSLSVWDKARKAILELFPDTERRRLPSSSLRTLNSPHTSYLHYSAAVDLELLFFGEPYPEKCESGLLECIRPLVDLIGRSSGIYFFCTHGT